MNLGFFADFKGRDAVLIDAEPVELADLADRLGRVAHSAEEVLPLHEMARVSKRHPVRLFASRAGCPEPGAFWWLCSPADIETIQGKLEPLAAGSRGHQFFDLIGTDTQLVVSVGEYGASWWEAKR